jgi:hypothetical protein
MEEPAGPSPDVVPRRSAPDQEHLMSSTLAARRDYRVADLSLAPFGRKEIHLAEH